MKKILPALCATLMLATPLISQAQPAGNGPGEQQQGQQKGNSQPGKAQQGNAQPGQVKGQQAPGKQTAKRSAPAPHRDWKSGGTAPAAYRGKQYQVSNWKASHLSQPPANHRWLKVNGDYVLVSIATGVIASIVTGR
jgi:Ni/Co efflux regulator RcnB